MKTIHFPALIVALCAPRHLHQFISQARSIILGVGLLFASLLGSVPQSQATGVAIAGNLANFDVRYPNSLPNDLEIVIYGAGLVPADVLSTFNNQFWGQAQAPVASVNNDPTSPAFGLDCITVRWVGPPLPAQVGQMLHFGVRLKVGRAVAHQEVWWTINGTRIARPCDPHVTWICSNGVWLICITNPTNVPFYVYGCRWFLAPLAGALPQLAQLNTNINPVAFGATGWTSLNLPQGPVFCIQPWCRIYLRVPVVQWRPIVFQMAARNVPENVLPLPPLTNGPNPNDFDGTNGTMTILTTRPTEEFAEDINGDGGVGNPDFTLFRNRFNAVSRDITGN
jgi:hypothetical protein